MAIIEEFHCCLMKVWVLLCKAYFRTFYPVVLGSVQAIKITDRPRASAQALLAKALKWRQSNLIQYKVMSEVSH